MQNTKLYFICEINHKTNNGDLDAHLKVFIRIGRHVVFAAQFAVGQTPEIQSLQTVGDSKQPSQVSQFSLQGPKTQFQLRSNNNSNAAPGPTAEFRTIDGSNNNVANPTLGMADTVLRRIAPSDYGDGSSSPAGQSRASARLISNLVLDQPESIENSNQLSSMVWQWGQFLDHDIDLTEGADPVEDFSILVPTGDPFFDPNSTGTATISLNRSIFEDVGGVREQLNEITTWIDGSNVYGSDEATAANLREFTGGQMRQSSGGLLPMDLSLIHI